MKKKNSLDKIEAAHGRILQLQKIKGALISAEGDVALMRSTQSKSCSSNSTGGCQIDCVGGGGNGGGGGGTGGGGGGGFARLTV